MFGDEEEEEQEHSAIQEISGSVSKKEEDDKDEYFDELKLGNMKYNPQSVTQMQYPANDMDDSKLEQEDLCHDDQFLEQEELTHPSSLEEPDKECDKNKQ